VNLSFALLLTMQSQRIFTIEKSFWYWHFQCKKNFIFHTDFEIIAFRTVNSRLKYTFLNAEKALFEKFEGQKTAFHSGNTGAKAHSKKQKSLRGKHST
jgi:hypothetical protein